VFFGKVFSDAGSDKSAGVKLILLVNSIGIKQIPQLDGAVRQVADNLHSTVSDHELALTYGLANCTLRTLLPHIIFLKLVSKLPLRSQ